MNERDKLLRTAIFDEIDTERKRQDGDMGHEFDDMNTPNDWVTFITRFLAIATDDSLGKVVQRYNREPMLDSDKRYRLNMLKTAAVCVSALEAFDRAQGTIARHYEQ